MLREPQLGFGCERCFHPELFSDCEADRRVCLKMPVGAVLSCLKGGPFKQLPRPRALRVAGARPGCAVRGQRLPVQTRASRVVGCRAAPDRLLADCFMEEAGNNQVTAPWGNSLLHNDILISLSVVRLLVTCPNFWLGAVAVGSESAHGSFMHQSDEETQNQGRLQPPEPC